MTVDDSIPGGMVEMPAGMFISMMEADAKIESELKLLRGQRRELLKQLDYWEKQGHATVGIDFLRRHLAVGKAK